MSPWQQSFHTNFIGKAATCLQKEKLKSCLKNVERNIDPFLLIVFRLQLINQYFDQSLWVILYLYYYMKRWTKHLTWLLNNPPHRNQQPALWLSRKASMAAAAPADPEQKPSLPVSGSAEQQHVDVEHPERRHVLTLNISASRGRVLRPLLYSQFSHDCVAPHRSNTIIKSADDTTVIFIHLCRYIFHKHWREIHTDNSRHVNRGWLCILLTLLWSPNLSVLLNIPLPL